MQELENILEEMKEIKDGNRKEKLYAKYPPHNEDQKVLNAYSQGYEDGTDNFYNAVVDIIRNHMNDGWIPVEERLPEEGKLVLVQIERYDKYLDMTLKDMDVMSLHDRDEKIFTSINRIPTGEIVSWRPLPEPYQPERTTQRLEWKGRMLHTFLGGHT